MASLRGSAIRCCFIAAAITLLGTHAIANDDCAAFQRMADLAVQGWPGYAGKSKFTTSNATTRELAKKLPLFEQCTFYDYFDDDAGVSCDLLAQIGAEPLIGEQSVESSAMWKRTAGSIAKDIGECLKSELRRPTESKAAEGREKLSWVVLAARPQITQTGVAMMEISIDQAKVGVGMNKHNGQPKLELYMTRFTRQAVSDAVPKQPPSKLRPVDFGRFAGLTMGSATGADVQRALGEPSKIEDTKNGKQFSYITGRLGVQFTFSPETQQVQWIHISDPEAVAWLGLDAGASWMPSWRS